MSDDAKVIKPDASLAVRRWRFGSVSGEVINAGTPEVQENIDDAQRKLLKSISAEEVEKLRAQAEAEGRAQGYQAGYAEGLAKAEAEIAELADRWRSQIEQLSAPLAKLDAALEAELLELVIAVARQIIRRELRTAPEQILGVLRESVALLSSSGGEIRIHAHPDDCQIIREQFADKFPKQWILHESPEISPGGCVVETATSRVDATIEARIAEIASRLLGGTRHEDT